MPNWFFDHNKITHIHILESKIHIALRIKIHNDGDIVDPITYVNIKNVTNWVKLMIWTTRKGWKRCIANIEGLLTHWQMKGSISTSSSKLWIKVGLSVIFLKNYHKQAGAELCQAQSLDNLTAS